MLENVKFFNCLSGASGDYNRAFTQEVVAAGFVSLVLLSKVFKTLWQNVQDMLFLQGMVFLSDYIFDPSTPPTYSTMDEVKEKHEQNETASAEEQQENVSDVDTKQESIIQDEGEQRHDVRKRVVCIKLNIDLVFLSSSLPSLA